MIKKLLAFGALALMLSTGAHAMTVDEETQLVTGQCASFIRSVDPRFDAYYDNVGAHWHLYGTQGDQYFFEKCLVEHGEHPTAP